MNFLKKYICLCFCINCSNSCCYQKKIFQAIARRDTKFMKNWILNKGDVNLKDQENSPLITHVVKSLNLPLIKFLLKQKNIKINVLDQSKKTPLDYAVNLENINTDSPVCLQHLQYEICKNLVRFNAKVTTKEADIKLRALLLQGKPKYNKTMLGFCMDHSPALLSQVATYGMPSFLGVCLTATTTFLSSFFIHVIDRVADFRRAKKYNKTFILNEKLLFA